MWLKKRHIISKNLRHEIESPLFPFKLVFVLSILLFSLSAFFQISIFNETFEIGLRFADISTLIILSFFLIAQKKYDQENPILMQLGAAVYCLTLFTILTLLQNINKTFDWEMTIGSFMAAIILNLGMISPSLTQSKIFRSYTITFLGIALLIASAQILYAERLITPYIDGTFSTSFKVINISTALLMISGVNYLLKQNSKEKDEVITPLIYYFAFIAITRFFVIFAEKPQLTWWIICLMRYGTNIIAISYLVSTYQSSLKVTTKRNSEIEKINSELLKQVRKNEENQKIIEEQRVKVLHSAQMSSIAKLSGIMAHEINNPLTSISLNTEFLLRRGKEDLTKEQETRIKKIYELTIRISDVIKRFLTLSHLHEHPVMENTDLNEIISNTIQFCGSVFTNNIDFIIDRIPHIYLRCDRSHISKALLSLLFNSFEAVKDCDEKWVHISFNIEQAKLFIKISDSGKGISQDISDKIMEPFFTTKDVNEGLGLGLSVSKAYIEENKGIIYLDKKADNTTFVIELPIETGSELHLQ
jgi:signal transduction histidine kinase